ncbi:DNA helicase [Tanacetum coccineum]|uniref:DNA helicase n=1 Tax=Tanacetum coccineum TaxID=301880 RepID=A0ABQ4Y8P1_9ASTR
MSIEIRKKEKELLQQEQAAYVRTSQRFNFIYYDDDDDEESYIPLSDIDLLIEEFAGELALIAPIPPGIVEANLDPKEYDNSFPRPPETLKDDSETVIDSNDDSTSIDDDSFFIDDIDYVDASPPDSELVSLEVVEIVVPKVGGIDSDILLTIKDDILREKLLNVNLLIAKIEALKDNPTPSSDFVTKSSSTSPNFFFEETNTFDNSLPESKTFCFNLEEKSSGNTTILSDYSLLDYEAFYLDDDHIEEKSSGSSPSLLHSTHGDDVDTHSAGSEEHCRHTIHAVDIDTYPNRIPSTGTQQRNTSLSIRRESTTAGDSLRGKPRGSGPPSEYKHIGSCTHSCQHCGALFCGLQRDIVEGVIDLLDAHNALVQLFRMAREKFEDMHIPNFKVQLYNVVGAREYELPTGDMLGSIVYEAGSETDMDYDIILEGRSGYPHVVNKLHLQFPLLFIYGQDDYSKELRMVSPTGSSSEQKHVTMLAYYAYYLHDRANRYNYLSRTGRLFQQYVVTAFFAIEQNRADFVRRHQNDIMNEYLSGIYDANNRGDNDGSDCGSRLILPQSFTGGPHYMYSHYLDALANCRVHKNLSYLITFTYVVDRVFEMKIHQFIDFLRDAQPFGRTVAVIVLYTVEFQNRGLPHCHMLLWIDESVRVRKEEDIDVYISVELPPEDVNPEYYRVVSKLMMHGPCRLTYPSASNIVTNSRVTPSWREIVSLTFSEVGVLHVNWTSYRSSAIRRD